MSAVEAPTLESALGQRLRAVRPLLLGSDGLVQEPQSARVAGDVLDALVRSVVERPSPDRFWLLCLAVSGSLPTADVVNKGVRFFRLAPAVEATIWILDQALEAARHGVAAGMEIEVVTGGVVVDVDHTARHDLHTGIQQVVRQVLPLWAKDHDIVPAVWTEPARAMRSLTDKEQSRALGWGQASSQSGVDDRPPVLVVPWRSVVVLPEVPFPDACDRLAALAQFSGNAVVAIGYDCIPAVSAEMVPPVESNKFSRYLTVVKHSRRVACIGSTATGEFKGFASALPVQGLLGPRIFEVPLPVEVQPGRGLARPSALDAGLPLVLCVGTFEPRKNQESLLYAAERLWREGLRFELLLIGGAGWIDSIPATVERLRARGRPVRARREASGAELQDAYRRARFTVFTSLHEGFGLPVAESFEHGTPAITSDFGSTREIGEAGGALLIDPYDDEALVSAMRSLLQDDELLQRLRQEIGRRPVRTWSEYAADLWDTLVRPEQDALPSGGGA